MFWTPKNKNLEPVSALQTIGIPRALFFHLYPMLWETFFKELGFQVLISEPTNRKTIERAGLISESEHCLPVKLFDAHLAELAEQVDLIFVPRVLSMLPKHIACPKLGALPDCARAQVPENVKILSVDLNEARWPLQKSLIELGVGLGVDKRTVWRAVERGIAALSKARDVEATCSQKKEGLRFLIIGHPYNLHDAYLAEPIFQTLERLGVYAEPVSFASSEVQPDPLKWDICSLIYDRLKNITHDKWDGVIHLSSFNCGCDSISSMLQHDILAKKKIPYMTLVLDEHAGQAGVDTRLEAFVDSIQEQHDHARTRH